MEDGRVGQEAAKRSLLPYADTCTTAAYGKERPSYTCQRRARRASGPLRAGQDAAVLDVSVFDEHLRSNPCFFKGLLPCPFKGRMCAYVFQEVATDTEASVAAL